MVERHPVEAIRDRQHRGRQVGQEIDVGLDDLGAALAEGQDAQRHPRVLGRDRDVDRRPVADVLATGRGGLAVERGGQEDLAARGVELEDLGRVGREAEAVVLRPDADLVGAAAQDRDVERVDRDFHQDLGACRRDAAAEQNPKRTPSAAGGSVSSRRRCSVQSPPFSTLVGTPGSGVRLPKAPPPPANSNEVM